MGCLASRPAQKEQEASHHVLVREPFVCGLLTCGTLHMQMVRLLRVLQIGPSSRAQGPDGKAADADANVMAVKIAAAGDRVDMSADSRCKPWVVPEGACKLQPSLQTTLCCGTWSSGVHALTSSQITMRPPQSDNEIATAGILASQTSQKCTSGHSKATLQSTHHLALKC